MKFPMCFVNKILILQINLSRVLRLGYEWIVYE